DDAIFDAPHILLFPAISEKVGPAIERFAVEQRNLARHGSGKIADSDVAEPHRVAMFLERDVPARLGTEAGVALELAGCTAALPFLAAQVALDDLDIIEPMLQVIVFQSDPYLVELTRRTQDLVLRWRIEVVECAG